MGQLFISNVSKPNGSLGSWAGILLLCRWVKMQESQRHGDSQRQDSGMAEWKEGHHGVQKTQLSLISSFILADSSTRHQEILQSELRHE